MKLLVTCPEELNLGHFYTDSFSLLITFTSGGSPVNLTGKSFQFIITDAPDSDVALATPNVSVTALSGQVLISGDPLVYSGLMPGQSYFYKFVQVNGISVQSILAGTYDFRIDPTNRTPISTLTVSLVTTTLTLQIAPIGSMLSWSHGSDAQMAIVAAQLLASGALAGSYIYFNTQQNSPYFWNGSAFA